MINCPPNLTAAESAYLSSINPSITAPAAAAVVDSGEYLVYTVQSGDYPSKIAGKYGVSVRKIMELNGLTEEAAKRIKVGQKLKIPKK